MGSKHAWKFFRAGGFDQVQLDSGADLLALRQLDQKLWVALSCPTRGVEFDGRTLDMIDMDADGQVRAGEVLAAIEWAGSLLKNSDLLMAGSDQLRLQDIADTHDEGKHVLASARHILTSLGKPQAAEISLQDMAGVEKLLAGLTFNGDGVICAGQIANAEVRATVEDIVRCAGSVADMSGDAGINQALADKFFADAAEFAAWHARGEADAGILILGDRSQIAAQSFQAVKEKITDYFTRCQMAAYDDRSALPLSRSTEDYQKVAAQSLSAASDELAGFPLAGIAPDKPLPLSSALNPAWQGKIAALRENVLQPVLGHKESLGAGEWAALCDKFSLYETWQAAKPGSMVGELGIARIREILAGTHQAAIAELVQQDLAVEPEIEAMRSVERLLRYKRDLYALVCNFVSFRDFYSGKHKAIFQMGTLYLDGRSCELCIQVQDINSHAVYANSSGVCLAYCELVRNGGAEKMNVAAAFTAGDADFLKVGRHGIFYDRKGQGWGATIVRISDHPISIRQAFWSPYKKLSQTISEQMQKFAASKADKTHETMTTAAAETGKSVAAPAAAPKPAFDVGKFAGIFAAIGLAIGAIGGILAAVVGGILSLRYWQIPLALGGLMLAVSGPSMVLAWFKLKRRNLGPVLDACGWAINARVLINIPFGTSLTALQALPEGAHRSLMDPYAEKKRAWPYVFGLLLILALLAWAWRAGYVGG